MPKKKRNKRTGPITAMKECGQHSWKEIGGYFGISSTTARARYLHRDQGGEVGPCPACHKSGRVEYAEAGNRAKFNVQTDGKKKLEEVIAELGVDMDLWKVAEFKFTRWDVGAKIRTGHLEWDKSVMTGHLDYKGLESRPLWSVSGSLVRHKPIAIKPVVQPVSVKVTWDAPKQEVPNYLESVFVICDMQMGYGRAVRDSHLMPFHDRRVVDIALQVCEDIQPGTIVFLGDNSDLADCSTHFIKEPSFYFTTQPVIEEGHWWFNKFRQACPDSRIIVTEGNHDARLGKALLTHFPAAYGLRAADELDLPPSLSMPRLWALHELGIEWVGGYPDNDVWLTPWLRAKHGHKVSQTPGGTANAMLKNGVSTIFAHCHRKESASETRTTPDGPVSIRAWTPGCACHKDGRVPGHKKEDNWQNGFGLVTYGTRSRLLSIQDTEVIDGEAVWGSITYCARDAVSNLKRDIPDWNW